MNTLPIPTSSISRELAPARRSYAAKYAVEYFERKRIPSYALWAVTLKDPETGRYERLPAGFGRTDTLEQAHLALTDWCQARNLTFANLRQDMMPWRLVKDLLAGKNGAEFFVRAIKRLVATGQILNVPKPDTDLVHIIADQVCTDSRKVAKKFKKTHGRVLRAIDNLPHDEFWKTNFGLRDYVTERGKTERYYEMGWKGFSIVAMGFTGKDAYEWKRDFLDAFESMGDYMYRHNQAIADPPRTGLLDQKRAAHDPMMLALVDGRTEAGKDTTARHFQCENRLCNWCVTGSFAALDESTLSNSDLELLRLVRERNAAFLMAELPYEVRKPKLAAYAIKMRTRLLAGPSAPSARPTLALAVAA